jgi:hypothetical protein
LSTREIVAKTEASVALIKGRLGSGSGFLVRPGVLVTNAHVIEEEVLGSLEIFFPSAAEGAKGPYHARLLDKNAKRDLAILSVESGLPALPLAKSYRFRKGEDVTIIGTPALGGGVDLQNAVARGILSTETVVDDHTYYQLGASVNAGNSGGPAIDSVGEVIGVVTAKARGQEAIGFCIPVDDVSQALARMESLDKSDQARLERLHKIEAVARCLHRIGGLCAQALDRYVAGMQASLARGLPADVGLHAAAESLGGRVPFLRSALTGPMETEMRAVIHDLELAAHIRRDLGELRIVVGKMKDDVERPRGTFQNFSTHTAALNNEFNRCIRKLELDLEIKFED